MTIFVLGFISGLPLALTASTLLTMLKDSGIEIQTIGLFASVGTPYALKYLWAPLIDNLNLPILSKILGRRRSWMFLCQILLMLSIITLGVIDPVTNLGAIAVVALTISTLSATQDIVIDAIRIEMLNENEQGAGASAVVFGYRLAMLTSTAGALILAHHFDWTFSYFCMGLLMMIGIITTLLISEPNVKKEVKVRDFGDWVVNAVINPFVEFLIRPRSLIILLFVILYKIGDAYLGVMTNPFLIELGFDKLEIAKVVKTYGFFATMAGIFVGGVLVERLGIKKSLFIGCALQTLSNLAFIVQAEAGHDVNVLTAVITIENFTGGLGTPAIIAYLSRLCNLNYTATQYAMFSAFASFARSFLSTPSGYFAVNLGWTNFFILTALLSIPAIFILPMCFQGDEVKKNNPLL